MRVVVVTGSSQGIGLALARALGARGDRVVVHGRDPARVEAAAHAVCGAVGVVADLATAEGPGVLVAGAVSAFGRIDVLVNNAGTTTAPVPLWELADDDLTDTIATNLLAPLRCARAVLAWAVPRGEPVRIVNVSSELAALPRAGATAYVASKCGLDGLTRALARDVAATGAVVTGVALGGVRTAMTARVLGPAEHAALPAPDGAVAVLLRAIGAPADDVHGRVLDGVASLDGRTAGASLVGASTIDAFADPIGPSPRARTALAEAAATGALERYPEAPVGLRKIVAARHGLPLDAVVVGAGTAELLDRALGVLAHSGDVVVANAPSWPVFPHACRAHGLVWRRVPYRIAGDRADHDLDAMLAAIDRDVRVVYLTSPANPGAMALEAAVFEWFAAAVPRHVTIVVDEAYIDYATRPGVLDAAACVAWLDRPLVVLRSLSKVHGLAGLRAGYALATAPVALRLARAGPAFPLVRGVEQAALAALTDGEHVRRAVVRATAARTALEARLDARGIARLASDAPFVLAATGGPPILDRYALLSIYSADG